MDTRNVLLDAAEAAIRANGHAGFSYGNLSAQVGIRKASIHHHFARKDDLITAVVARYRKRLAAALDVLEDWKSEAPARRIAELAGIYRAPVAEGEGVCLCVALSTGQEGLSAATLATMRETRTAVLDFLDRALGELKAMPYDAPACLAVMEGAQIAARTSGEIEEFDRAISGFRRALRDVN